MTEKKEIPKQNTVCDTKNINKERYPCDYIEECTNRQHSPCFGTNKTPPRFISLWPGMNKTIFIDKASFSCGLWHGCFGFVPDSWSSVCVELDGAPCCTDFVDSNFVLMDLSNLDCELFLLITYVPNVLASVASCIFFLFVYNRQ